MQLGVVTRLKFSTYSRKLRLPPRGYKCRSLRAALESRPAVDVTFPEGTLLAGKHRIHGGYEPDVLRGLFYARDPEGGNVWPTIQVEGKKWRIQCADETFWEAANMVERDPQTTGWQFDADPVEAPGEVWAEPSYISYTPASPDYLRHWLTRSWPLGDTPEGCPWSLGQFVTDPAKVRYERDLPLIRQLNFPDYNTATGIECCLHNGMIEEALQAAITRLKDQTAILQRNLYVDRDIHVGRLLKRWHASETKEI